MTDWTKIAEARALKLSTAEAEQAQRVLAAMEESFAKAKAQLRPSVLMDTLGKDDAK